MCATKIMKDIASKRHKTCSVQRADLDAIWHKVDTELMENRGTKKAN